MEINLFMAAGLAIPIITTAAAGLSALRTPVEPGKLRVLRYKTAYDALPKPLQPTARLVTNFYRQRGIVIKAAAGVVSYRSSQIDFDIDRNVETKKIERTAHDLEHYLRASHVDVLDGSLNVKVSGTMVVSFNHAATQPVILSKIFGYGKRGEKPLDGSFVIGLDLHGKALRLPMDTGGYPHTMVLGSTGSGKALDVNTPIPTPSGWSRMGDLSVGDRVFDEKGNVCNVIGAHPVMLGNRCYEVCFSDGSSIVADAEHLWLTHDANSRRSDNNVLRAARKNKTSEHRKPQRQCFPAVITTQEILDTLKTWSDNRVNHAIKIAQPLCLPDVDLPIDPYVLGAWLGDGSSGRSFITIGDKDKEEIIAEIEAAGHIVYAVPSEEIGYSIDPTTNHDKGKEIRNNTLYAKLRNMNLLHNKHIPDIYMRSSFEQRLALVQGLMDTDGHAQQNGHLEYTTMSKILAVAMRELIVSLGCKATINTGRVMLNGKDYGIKYRISFTSPFPAFRLSRKLKRQKVPSRRTQDYQYIVDVKEVESRPVRCITVDSESHLYLAGESMIPTHNTVAMLVLAVNAMYLGWDIFILNPKLPPNERLTYGLWQLRDASNVVYAQDYNDMAVAANELAQTMDRVRRPTLILVDEAADVLTRLRDDISVALGTIAQKGREYGVHLALGVPKATKDVLLNDMLHANAGTTLIGMRMNSSLLSHFGSGVGGMDLHMLAGEGHCKIKIGPSLIEGQIALPDNLERYKAVGEARRVESNNLLPVTAEWINSLNPGDPVSKALLREYAHRTNRGIVYQTVQDQYDVLVRQGRIEQPYANRQGVKVK